MFVGFLRRTALYIGAVLAPLSMAHAGVVDFTTTSLGGNLWRYDYTINNETPSIGFDELTVYFDVNDYELLSSPVAPDGWDPLIIQPDPGIPADGFYDVLKLDGLLGQGVSVSGFSVSFAYLVDGTPGAQSFDLLDSSDFSVVYAGTTTVLSAVPEPASLALMLAGLVGIYGTRRVLNPPSV